jgi:hypothetical protein
MSQKTDPVEVRNATEKRPMCNFAQDRICRYISLRYPIVGLERPDQNGVVECDFLTSHLR